MVSDNLPSEWEKTIVGLPNASNNYNNGLDEYYVCFDKTCSFGIEGQYKIINTEIVNKVIPSELSHMVSEEEFYHSEDNQEEVEEKVEEDVSNFFINTKKEEVKEINGPYANQIINYEINNPKLKLELNNNKNLFEVRLPQDGKRLVSEFAEEVGKILGLTKMVFFRPEVQQLVEVGFYKDENKEGEEEIVKNVFLEIKPDRLVTLLEKFIVPGCDTWVRATKDTDGYWEFQKRSISKELANKIIESPFFQNQIPAIKRIFTCPIPILYKDSIVTPKQGYDERFSSFLTYDSPKLKYPYMNLKTGVLILNEILSEFCFASEQDKTNALASILTPYCRGLYGDFTTRTPLFFYRGNRERCGKDFLAAITRIIIDGYVLTETPIVDNEELRKKIISSLIIGRRLLHFANCKGKIIASNLEMITTEKNISDRILGASKMVSLPNEIDFSISGNLNCNMTSDLAYRTIPINLFLSIEDPNTRKFKHPNLHQLVFKKRDVLLSALNSLVLNWDELGRPSGSIPFTSFPEWAEIIGGILESANIGSPCKKSDKDQIIAIDPEVEDMKILFESSYKYFGDKWISKDELKNFIKTNLSDLVTFGYYDFDNKRSDQIKLGLFITSFRDRIFSDIKLLIKDTSIRSSRQEIKFVKLNNLNKSNGDK